MYGIRAHVHFARTFAPAVSRAGDPAGSDPLHPLAGGLGAAGASVVVAGRRPFGASGSGPDGNESSPRRVLEAALAAGGVGRPAGCPSPGTTEEADGGEGSDHPGRDAESSPQADHALVESTLGPARGGQPCDGDARVAQGRTATPPPAALHGQPRSGL